MKIKKSESLPRGSKTIRIPCTEEEYSHFLNNPPLFREQIVHLSEKNPELFPSAISHGFHLHGFTQPSVKMDGLVLYRIKLLADGETFTIAPSYVIPYMRGKATDVESAFFC